MGYKVKKLAQYVKEKRLSKFKSYVKKHKVPVAEVRVEKDQTLLHLACAAADDHCMRYLLKQGVDPLTQDVDGNLPLHIAALTARGQHMYVYVDLVLPLLKKCPRALDVENYADFTPRQLLRNIKEKLEQKQREDESGSSAESGDNDEEEEEFAEKEEEKDDYEDWMSKLQDEMSYETQESWGKQTNDYAEEEQEAACYDDWADKMRRDYHRKHSIPYAREQANQRAKRQKLHDDDAKRDFQQKLEKEHEEYMRKQSAKAKERKLLKAKESLRGKKTLYEKCYAEVFSGGTGTDSELGYGDIPWPDEGDADTCLKVLLCDVDKRGDSAGYRKYLREQRVRWHPDKFLQKLGQRLKAEDHDKILAKVKEISQALNKLSEEATS